MEYGFGTPGTELIVEARSLLSHDSSASVETYQVHRPAGIGRQRDQLVRAALKLHPDADVATVDDGIATLYSRTQMIVAYYGSAGSSRVKDQFERGQAGSDIPF